MLVFNRLRGLRFAARECTSSQASFAAPPGASASILFAEPWNHLLGMSFMAYVGHQIGQTNEGVHFWAAAQREAVSKLPSWAAEIAQEKGRSRTSETHRQMNHTTFTGWSTDGMGQAQAVREARRGVLLEDQAAFRAAFAQHQRALLDGDAAGKFISAAAPSSLPHQSPDEFATFVKALAADDESAHASLLKRVNAAAVPPPLPAGTTTVMPGLQAGCDLVADVFAIVQPSIESGNLQALRQYLSDQSKADSVLALQADGLLKAARPALQLAHAQLATAKPDSDGNMFIDLPVFCELKAEGLMDSVDSRLESIKCTSRMPAKYLVQLEQLVHTAEKRRLVSGARMARKSDRTPNEMGDEEVLALARRIHSTGLGMFRFVLNSMHPHLLRVFAVALMESGSSDQGMSLALLSRLADDFISTHLTADGVQVASPHTLFQDAQEEVAKFLKEADMSDDERAALGVALAANLTMSTVQHALNVRLPPQHMPAIMAEFGWDYAAADVSPIEEHRQSALELLSKAAEVEETEVAVQAAFAEQFAVVLQEHTEVLLPKDRSHLSKGTQRYLARCNAQSRGLTAMLNFIGKQVVRDNGGVMKPSEVRTAALQVKKNLLQLQAEKQEEADR